MSSQTPSIPETRVLAVASHVVSGYVGNKIAVFAMQALGCDVAALNTVQFSNHTGYGQFKGTRVSAQEIDDLYEGLKQSHLNDFDMMVTGYIPGAAAVEAVGRIAVDLKQKADPRPGSFFWVLDPVMGDHGSLYVAQDVIPAYKSLVSKADLILPNQFEAELLSEVKITDVASLNEAISVLHKKYNIPHVVITSVSLDLSTSSTSQDTRPASSKMLAVVGSSMRPSDGSSRTFKIVFPAIDAYFSGTGDMFAALMVVRMRQAVTAASISNESKGSASLGNTRSWLSEDSVEATQLPLARAAEMVLATMHEVLEKTCEDMKGRIARATPVQVDGEVEDPKEARLRKSKAAELRLVRHLDCLRSPTMRFKAENL